MTRREAKILRNHGKLTTEEMKVTFVKTIRNEWLEEPLAARTVYHEFVWAKSITAGSFGNV